MRRLPSIVFAFAATGCGIGLDPLGGYVDSGAEALDLGDDGADGGSGSGGDSGSGSGGDSGSGSGGDSGSGSGGDSGSGCDGGSGGDSGSGSGTDGGSSGGSSGGSTGGSSSGGGSTGGSGGGPSDNDGDGYTSDVDCDDNDRTTYPGAAWAESSSACMTDADADGYGDQYPSSGVTAGSDCDDANPSLSGADNDFDGYSTCLGDCDDSSASVSPGAYDTPFDGIDQDCTGADAGSIVTATGTTGAITDLTTTVGEATVTGCGTVYDVDLTVDITHTWVADLGIALHEPTLTNYAIVHYFTGYYADLYGTYSSSGGGTLTPYESLSYLTGGSGDGTWYLEIYDEAYFDDGWLNSWSLTLYCL